MGVILRSIFDNEDKSCGAVDSQVLFYTLNQAFLENTKGETKKKNRVFKHKWLPKAIMKLVEELRLKSSLVLPGTVLFPLLLCLTLFQQIFISSLI